MTDSEVDLSTTPGSYVLVGDEEANPSGTTMQTPRIVSSSTIPVATQQMDRGEEESTQGDNISNNMRNNARGINARDVSANHHRTAVSTNLLSEDTLDDEWMWYKSVSPTSTESYLCCCCCDNDNFRRDCPACYCDSNAQLFCVECLCLPCRYGCETAGYNFGAGCCETGMCCESCIHGFFHCCCSCLCGSV